MKSKAEETQNPTVDVEHELPQAEAAANSAPATELEKLKAENAAYLDRLARLQAEFDNFRKRNARELQEFRDYALTDALKQLLPILDSLDRATKAEAATVEDMRNGLELIDRQFHDTLSRLGVEPIETKGQKFDPNLHQAVAAVPSAEVEEGGIVEELARGYRLRDRVLRATMVSVAKAE
ncbi:MAG: nucleotide exchange factor GrpE [Acidobacteriota bacterium]|nr:nucleotide exchange factor GrpE [Acidobacteriota bacterium]